MTGTFNSWLVILSMVVATLGSFVSLDLASRVRASQGRTSMRYWQVGGALSIGTSIWTQHFVGMLAFRLPIPVAYDGPLTVLSWLLPVIVSGYGLLTVGKDVLTTRRLAVAGLLVGSGIVGMHYTGMAAMRMQPPIEYHPGWVGISIAVAITAATASLWIAFKLRHETILSAFQRKAGSAFVLGLAIYGMHYAGMVAASFHPQSVCMASPLRIDPLGLAGIVAATSLTLLVITMLISALDTYRADLLTRQAKELEQRFAEHTVQLRELSHRLVSLQEAERRELARELHDRVGQNLTALGINMALVDRDSLTPSVHERLVDSENLLESTFKAIENVVADLRPPLLEESGLMPALELLLDQFSRRTRIEVELHGEHGKRLPADVELAFFRVAQEALNNTARHGQAHRVQLDLYDSGDQTVFTIADDGVGFDPVRPSGGKRGLGLVTMRERCEAVGARFEVEVGPAGGTVVTVTYPHRS